MKFGGVLVMGFHSIPIIGLRRAESGGSVGSLKSRSGSSPPCVANEADTFLSTTYGLLCAVGRDMHVCVFYMVPAM